MFNFAQMLQDPAVREKLLNNLSMSPLDPAAAMQQLGASGAMGGGMPGGGMQPPPGFSAAPPMGGMPPGMGNMPPMPVNPGIQFGPDGQIPGGPGIQLPPGAFPGGPQVPGLPPEMPTQIGGPGIQAGNLDFGNVPLQEPFDIDRLKASLMGLAGQQQRQPPQPLRAPPSGGGGGSREVDMEMLKTMPVGDRITLADLLYRRGR
jgi:hypothetical protein